MPTDSRTNDAAYLRITAGATYLGIARSTVYRLIKAGLLPVYRLTRDAPRLKKADLEAYAQKVREGGP